MSLHLLLLSLALLLQRHHSKYVVQMLFLQRYSICIFPYGCQHQLLQMLLQYLHGLQGQAHFRLKQVDYRLHQALFHILLLYSRNMRLYLLFYMNLLQHHDEFPLREHDQALQLFLQLCNSRLNILFLSFLLHLLSVML